MQEVALVRAFVKPRVKLFLPLQERFHLGFVRLSEDELFNIVINHYYLTFHKL